MGTKGTTTIIDKSTKTSKQGLPDGKIRATFILKEDSLEKLKDLAFMSDKGINETVNDILSYYIELYEKKNGKIKSRKPNKVLSHLERLPGIINATSRK